MSRREPPAALYMAYMYTQSHPYMAGVTRSGSPGGVLVVSWWCPGLKGRPQGRLGNQRHGRADASELILQLMTFCKFSQRKAGLRVPICFHLCHSVFTTFDDELVVELRIRIRCATFLR